MSLKSFSSCVLGLVKSRKTGVGFTKRGICCYFNPYCIFEGVLDHKQLSLLLTDAMFLPIADRIGGWSSSSSNCPSFPPLMSGGTTFWGSFF